MNGAEKKGTVYRIARQILSTRIAISGVANAEPGCACLAGRTPVALSAFSGQSRIPVGTRGDGPARHRPEARTGRIRRIAGSLLDQGRNGRRIPAQDSPCNVIPSRKRSEFGTGCGGVERVHAMAAKRRPRKKSTVAVTDTVGSCHGYRERGPKPESDGHGSWHGYRHAENEAVTVAATATQVLLPSQGCFQ